MGSAPQQARLSPMSECADMLPDTMCRGCTPLEPAMGSQTSADGAGRFPELLVVHQG